MDQQNLSSVEWKSAEKAEATCRTTSTEPRQSQTIQVSPWSTAAKSADGISFDGRTFERCQWWEKFAWDYNVLSSNSD